VILPITNKWHFLLLCNQRYILFVNLQTDVFLDVPYINQQFLLVASRLKGEERRTSPALLGYFIEGFTANRFAFDEFAWRMLILHPYITIDQSVIFINTCYLLCIKINKRNIMMSYRSVDIFDLKNTNSVLWSIIYSIHIYIVLYRTCYKTINKFQPIKILSLRNVWYDPKSIIISLLLYRIAERNYIWYTIFYKISKNSWLYSITIQFPTKVLSKRHLLFAWPTSSALTHPLPITPPHR
jgi:hypothetical protein